MPKIRKAAGQGARRLTVAVTEAFIRVDVRDDGAIERSRDDPPVRRRTGAWVPCTCPASRAESA